MPGCSHWTEDDVRKLADPMISISPQSSDCEKKKKERAGRRDGQL